MIDLDHLEKLCRCATPGPWNAEYDEADDWYCITGAEYFDGGHWVVCPVVATVERGGEDDAVFIAAARTAVPQLIARIRELESRLGGGLS